MKSKCRRRGDMDKTHFHKRHFSFPMQHFSFVKTRATFNQDEKENAMGARSCCGDHQAALLLAPSLEGPRPRTAPECAFARLLFGK